MPGEDKKKVSVCDTIRFYMTALTILVACFSSFAFLFLVPFVIDPAFSTLFAEFVEDPVVCVTTSVEFKLGISNCTWSSCREGCTREIFKCAQIYVNYKVDAADSFAGKNLTDEYQIARTAWDYTEARLHPNVKGCGYPPEVNCTIFDKKYSIVGATFPCFYSKLMPDIALTSLNIEKVKYDLIYAIAIPWALFLFSILYLLITYVGMTRPDPKADEPQEISSAKASKDASNYSLRSIGKSINQGMNKFRGDQDDKGASTPANGTDPPEALRSQEGGSVRPSSSLTPIDGDGCRGGLSGQPTDGRDGSSSSRCGDGFCLKDKNLLLEPSSLQQVHSRRPTSLPPLDRTPPIMPGPLRDGDQMTGVS